jgi:hypothetical protein
VNRPAAGVACLSFGNGSIQSAEPFFVCLFCEDMPFMNTTIFLLSDSKIIFKYDKTILIFFH